MSNFAFRQPEWTTLYGAAIKAVALKHSKDSSHLGQPEFMEGQNRIT